MEPSSNYFLSSSVSAAVFDHFGSEENKKINPTQENTLPYALLAAHPSYREYAEERPCGFQHYTLESNKVKKKWSHSISEIKKNHSYYCEYAVRTGFYHFHPYHHHNSKNNNENFPFFGEGTNADGHMKNGNYYYNLYTSDRRMDSGDYFFKYNPCYSHFSEFCNHENENNNNYENCNLYFTAAETTPFSSLGQKNNKNQTSIIKRRYVYVFPDKHLSVPTSFQHYVWWLRRNQNKNNENNNNNEACLLYLSISPSLLLSEYENHKNNNNNNNHNSCFSEIHIHGLHFNHSFLYNEKKSFGEMVEKYKYRTLKHLLNNNNNNKNNDDLLDDEIAFFIYERLFKLFRNHQNNKNNHNFNYLEEVCFNGLDDIIPSEYTAAFLKVFSISNENHSNFQNNNIHHLNRHTSLLSHVVRLDLSGSKKIKNITFLKNFRFLEMLNVSGCAQLTHAFDEINNNNNNEDEEDLDNFQRNKYQYNNAFYFPFLKIFIANNCPQLLSLSFLLPQQHQNHTTNKNTTLRELSISNSKSLSSSHLLFVLDRLPNLEHLNLSETNFYNNNSVFSFLQNMKNLHYFNGGRLDALSTNNNNNNHHINNNNEMIQHFKSLDALKILDLSDNPFLTSLSFLAHPSCLFSLKNLKKIDISCLTNVKDYSPISSCCVLESFTAIGFLQPLQNVMNGQHHNNNNSRNNNFDEIFTFLLPSQHTLKSIGLRNNDIPDEKFSLLSHFLYNGCLEYLDLCSSVCLQDLSFFIPNPTKKNQKKCVLKKLIFFDCTQVVDFSPLWYVKNALDSVYLSSKKLSSLSFFENDFPWEQRKRGATPPLLTSENNNNNNNENQKDENHVRRVYLFGCSTLHSLTPLRDLTNLTDLHITQCSAPEMEKSIESIQFCIHLERLNLHHCATVKNLRTVLGPLRQLRMLALRSCDRLETLGPVLPLRRLRELYYAQYAETTGNNENEIRFFEEEDLEPRGLKRLSNSLLGSVKNVFHRYTKNTPEEREDEIFTDSERSYRVFPNYFSPNNENIMNETPKIMRQDGIQNCLALHFLTINDCPNVKDISAVALLPQLKCIQVNHAGLVSVESLRYCTSLEELGVWQCPCGNYVKEETFQHLPLLRRFQGREVHFQL